MNGLLMILTISLLMISVGSILCIIKLWKEVKLLKGVQDAHADQLSVLSFDTSAYNAYLRDKGEKDRINVINKEEAEWLKKLETFVRLTCVRLINDAIKRNTL